MSDIDRRRFLGYSAGIVGRTAAGFTALNALSSCTRLPGDGQSPRPIAGLGNGGYGSLRPAGSELALPRGFSYHVIGVEGSRMSDGYRTPGSHDGMCAFPLPNGNIRLIRNHEVQNNPAPDAAIGDGLAAYDPGAGGGTTSLEIDPETRKVVRDFVSLSGTWRNCAGGPTPWGSWLSCEEAFYGPESGFAEFHGYVFEVPASRERAERTPPIRALGRFVHEALAIDPTSGIVYETEDHFEAGFYRFLPNEPHGPHQQGNLHAGGRLQMLAVVGRAAYDTARGQSVGLALPVTWVEIPDADPRGGPDGHDAVFAQGRARGGARFSRLEGCWYADGNVYFVATDGGDAELGQVWQYTPEDDEGGMLTLVFESRHRNVLNRPDNVCVSPGGAIILCEDSHERRKYVRGLTADGHIFDIAGNLANTTELAGATFSPDGRTLFFNAMGDAKRGWPGKTFAVWGPWEDGAV